MLPQRPLIVSLVSASKAATLEQSWVLERILINLAIVGGYYSFWSVSFSVVGITARKFSPDTRSVLRRQCTPT